MNLLDMVFWRKLSGGGRCPRGAADAELNMEDWERRYFPSGAAAEITEED